MLASLLTFSIMPAGFCADTVDAGDPSLAKLEQKFFQHNYQKDPLSQRLDRIEKMVFGEAKEGPERQRLNNLVQAVPTLNDVSTDNTSSAATASSGQSTSERTAGTPQTSRKPASKDDSDDVPPGTNYPAVSAIENKLFNKEFRNERVEDRLSRLETKVFGKVSQSDDLSERVDRLKQSTGIDVAARPPAGSDWDDDDTFMPPTFSSSQRRNPQPSQSPYIASDDEDGKSFSGRDLRKDMQKAFPNRSGGSYGGAGSSSLGSFGASGSYGGAGGGSISSNSASGSYGFGGGSAYPKTAPPIQRAPGAPSTLADASQGMGLNQQVSSLEMEIFNKTYAKDPLPARVTRIESTVFPNEKPAVEKPLPDRVNKLLSVIQISGPGASNKRKVAQKSADPDFPDLDLDSDIPQPAPQRGGLSKIINGIGNLLGGGGGFVGGYPMGMGNGLMTDPQTGLLIDQYGSLIDPNTGQVIGRRVAPPAYAPRYGAPSPYPSFNNGFSPMMPGMGMGSGMNFGFGGMGIGRSYGGMWP